MTTAEDVQKFVGDREVAVVGFFASAESDEAKSYLSAAEGIDDLEFGIVLDAAVAKANEVEGNGIVLFKKVRLSL